MPVKKTKAAAPAKASKTSAMPKASLPKKPRFLPPQPLQVETQIATATTPTLLLGVGMICAVLVGVAFIANMMAAAVSISNPPPIESNERANNFDISFIPNLEGYKKLYLDPGRAKFFNVYAKSKVTLGKFTFTDQCYKDVASSTGFIATPVASCTQQDNNCHLKEGFVITTPLKPGTWDYNCPFGCKNGACLPGWITNGESKNWIFYDMSSDGKYRMLGQNDNKDKTVKVSSDFGHSWRVISLLDMYMNTDLAISKTGKYQLISPFNGYLLISDNFGNKWNSVTSTKIYVSSTATTTGGWVVLPLQPITIRYSKISSDGSVIIAYNQTSNKVVISRNMGRSWMNLLSINTNDSVTTISISDDGSRILVGTVSNGMFISNDAGLTWNNISDKYYLRGSDMSNNGQYMVVAGSIEHYGGAQGETIFLSKDYGNSWSPVLTEPNRLGWSSVAVSDSGKKISAIAWGSKDIMNSIDGGITWNSAYHFNGELGKAWQKILISGNGYYQTAIAQGDPVYYYPF